MNNKGGRPPITAGGYNKVLFIRCTQNLLDELDKLVAIKKKQNPGIPYNRSNIARMILYKEIQKDEL
jgi:hypothetical protein